ncbi:MAG: hypothetical protein AB1Z98_40035 [Nannocystaceae bacterium]
MLCIVSCASDDASSDDETDGAGTSAPGSGDSTAAGSTSDASTSGVDTGSTSDGGSSGGDSSDGGETTGGEMQSPIVSAYHGLDMLPAQAAALCGPAGVGQDGMPVAFSSQLVGDTVVPGSFSVRTPDGRDVVPTCATLAPALEPLELHTVLLAGPFSMDGEVPLLVEVTGPVETLDGEILEGASTEDITPLAEGPQLFLAERYPPDQVGLEDECPEETLQVVHLAWQGGVSGPDGAVLGEPQRLGVHVTLTNGDVVEPIALGDDDPDNYVVACLDQDSPAVSVAVDADLFYDPGDDPNPQTAIDVVEGGV